MNPVLVRELRTHARGSGPLRLRVFLVGAATLGLGVLLLTAPNLFAGSGMQAFLVLASGATLLLAIACPILTHDLMSRELREGTLGLLCATPLTARELVLGKIANAAIQSFSAWAATGPFMLIPILQGGVRPSEVFLALSIQGSVVLTGLSAGLVASCWNRSAGWALLTAYALLAMVGLALLAPASIVIAVSGGITSSYALLGIAGLIWFVSFLIAFGFYQLAAQESDHTWHRLQHLGDATDELLHHLPPPPPTPPPTPGTAAATRALHLPADGERPQPPPDPQPPAPPTERHWSAFFRKRRRATLESDPFRWLLIRGSIPGLWLGLWPLIGYGWLLSHSLSNRIPAWPQYVLPAILALRLHRLLDRERQGGMWEVIATTPAFESFPFSLRRLLWQEFLPIVGLHVVLVFFTGLPADTRMAAAVHGLFFLFAAFWVGPWIGQFVALRVHNYLLAALATFIAMTKLGAFLGWLPMVVLRRLRSGYWELWYGDESGYAWGAAGIHFLATFLVGWISQRAVCAHYRRRDLRTGR